MPNKKGMELSAMFLVTLILTILVFIFSVYFAFRIYTGGQELKQQLDVQTEEELQRLIVDQNAIVALYPSSRNARIGEEKIFGVGIRNMFDIAENFKIVASFAGAYSPDGKTNYCPDNEFDECGDFVNENWLGNFRISNINIKPQKLQSMPISIRIGNQFSPSKTTRKGMYKFNVCVYDEETGAASPEDDCTFNERQLVYPKGQGRIYQFEISI